MKARGAAKVVGGAAQPAPRASSMGGGAASDDGGAASVAGGAASVQGGAPSEAGGVAQQAPRAAKRAPRAAKQVAGALKQEPRAAKQAAGALKQEPRATKEPPRAAKQAAGALKQEPRAASLPGGAALEEGRGLRVRRPSVRVHGPEWDRSGLRTPAKEAASTTSVSGVAVTRAGAAATSGAASTATGALRVTEPSGLKVKLKLTPELSREIQDYRSNQELAAEVAAKQKESVPLVNCEDASSDCNKVFLIYDQRMNGHRPLEDDPESSKRIPAIIAKLKETGLLYRCQVCSEATEVEEKYVLEVHTERFIHFLKKLPMSAKELKRYYEFLSDDKEERKEFVSSTGTSLAVFLAAGAVVEACYQVASGNYHSAFALVRPPGHHSKQSTANGFCFLNNIAIGAKYLQRVHGAKRLLVIDFDVHHGDGTQQIFYHDGTVLFCSIQRGNIFPISDKGYSDIGEGEGRGFTINVSLDHTLVNEDMLAVFEYLFLPVGKNYNPDYILVSAGFDAAVGDELGESNVTPDCFGQLIRKLKNTRNANMVLALEGGYNLDSLASSCAECVKELLNTETTTDVECKLEDVRPETLEAINKVISGLIEYWPCLKEVDTNPKELLPAV